MNTEAVECDLCGKVVTLESASKLGWDWFTGYLPKTFHACYQCQKRAPEIVKGAFAKSRRKPNS